MNTGYEKSCNYGIKLQLVFTLIFHITRAVCALIVATVVISVSTRTINKLSRDYNPCCDTLSVTGGIHDDF